MTLKEAINHCHEKADELERCGGDCAADHRQLARWLEELDGLRKKSMELQEEVDSLKRDLGQFL